jgi:aspartyl protease family protein
MLFWPLAVIALVALAVAQLAGAFPDALRQEGAAERLLYLGLLLTLVLIWGFRYRRVRLRPVAMMAAGWLAAFSALIVAWTYREEAVMIFDRVRGEVTPTLALSRTQGEAELRKAWDGHFRAVATVNGANVGMMVDTGASLVLLSYEDAAAVGLRPETLAFTQPVSTANGRAFVATVTLDEVAIGAVGLTGVRAAVAEEGRLSTSLLGMSFLGRLSETSFRGDRLILRE